MEIPVDDGIVLYTYWRSSAAYRVRIGLELKGLAWEARGASGARRWRAAP